MPHGIEDNNRAKALQVNDQLPVAPSGVTILLRSLRSILESGSPPAKVAAALVSELL